MTIEVDKEYTEKAIFLFNPPEACPQQGTTCLKVIQESDSIEFKGELTKVPMDTQPL